MAQARALNVFQATTLEIPKITHFPLKRAFDLCFSTAVMLLGFPVFAVIALAIAMTSRGPVIFSHERIGRGGQPFRCYKFRTMFVDAEERLERLLMEDPLHKAEWAAQRKLKNDPRVTRLGRFLRQTSLDELPQFWNVLLGDLSVVGPRAVVRDEVLQYMGHRARKILSIRPGLTGIWQVSGRSDTSYESRMQMDEYYVENRSFFGDLALVARTVPAMFSRKGAY
jgi:undecaprenyl-phosphate galactose phosphotransferase